MPKIAADSQVIITLIDILREEGEIIGEIRLIDSLGARGISISPLRLRKIIYSIPQIKVTVEFSKKSRMVRGKCPICGSKLYPYRGINLEGKRKIIGHRCKKCGFNTAKHGKPLIYSFRLMNHDL